MNTTLEKLRIDTERFRRNFDTQAEIGRVPDAGITRPVFSPSHTEVRQWFLEQSRNAGLETTVDGAGNHSAALSCGDSDAPTLLMGSHLDSVPNGGAYDGALGVLSGLEVLQTIKDAGLPLKLSLEVIDFTDEEGAYIGLLGSRALTGTINHEHLQTPRGDRTAFDAALTQAGLTGETILGAKRDPRSLAGYLELHVEQGGRLEGSGLELGIVTGIVGVRSFKVSFLGRANHAGTTPMNGRLDASLGASAFTLAARELVLNDFPESVVNVGNMSFEPGAFNIVPERVTLDLEFRSDTLPKLEALETGLLESVAHEAERFGLNIDIKPVGKVPPAPMADKIQAAFMEAGQDLNLSGMNMISGAGHDAQSMAAICPTGMIFIPSIGGISHAPKEFSRWEDCINGANVLLKAVLALAS